MMNFEYSPYALPLIAAALVSIVVLAYAWKYRAANGAYALLLMAVSIFEWTFAYALEIMGATLETKYFWGAIQYFGIAFVPYGWLVFAISYANLNQWLSRRLLTALGLIPCLTLLFALTNQWHGLIWSAYHVQRQGDFSALGTSYGAWFWVHFGYSYAILLAGTFLVMRALWRKPGAYRGQMIAMLVAVFAPWVGNALYITGKSPIPYLDLTPFAFTVTVAALTWAIFGFRLMDIKPLARDRIMDLMGDGVIILNLRDNVVDINPAAAQMVGVPVRSAIGKSVEEIFHPWQSLVEQLHASPKIETEISVGEGEAKRLYEVRVSPLKDEYGQSTGRIVMLRSMSGAEFSQPRMTAQASVAGDANPTIRDGKPPAMGKISFSVFFAPRIKMDIPLDPRYSPAWSRTLERIFTTFLRFAAALGLFAAVLALPNVYGQFEYFLSTLLIVAIFWALALWRTLHLSIRTAIFIIALYGLTIVELLNFGYSVEAFIYCVAIVIIGVLFEELRGGIITLLISLVILAVFGFLIAQRIYLPVSAASAQIAPPDLRSAFITLVTYTAAASGLIAAITVLLRNVNRAWQAETQALNLLQQERDLLEQHVAERTRDLAAARDQALEASRFKTRLLARVSHELRTPLGGVLGYAELVEAEVFGEINAEQRDAMQKIVESTNYLTGIVNDLLDAAEIEAANLDLKPAVFAPEGLLQSVNDHLTPLAQQKGLQLKTEIVPPFPAKLYGDEKRLRQILENLASNAIKFTPPGSVNIRFHQPMSDQWSLEVTDTGIGIPPEAQQHIFLPFQQLNQKITRDNRGAGLGLFIVKQLVDLMGGFIEVQSEPNQGSAFVIRLPIIQPQEKIV